MPRLLCYINYMFIVTVPFHIKLLDMFRNTKMGCSKTVCQVHHAY